VPAPGSFERVVVVVVVVLVVVRVVVGSVVVVVVEVVVVVAVVVVVVVVVVVAVAVMIVVEAGTGEAVVVVDVWVGVRVVGAGGDVAIEVVDAGGDGPLCSPGVGVGSADRGSAAVVVGVGESRTPAQPLRASVTARMTASAGRMWLPKCCASVKIPLEHAIPPSWGGKQFGRLVLATPGL